MTPSPLERIAVLENQIRTFEDKLANMEVLEAHLTDLQNDMNATLATLTGEMKHACETLNTAERKQEARSLRWTDPIVWISAASLLVAIIALVTKSS